MNLERWKVKQGLLRAGEGKEVGRESGYKVSFWKDENIQKMDYSDGHMTKNIELYTLKRLTL